MNRSILISSILGTTTSLFLILLILATTIPLTIPHESNYCIWIKDNYEGSMYIDLLKENWLQVKSYSQHKGHNYLLVEIVERRNNSLGFGFEQDSVYGYHSIFPAEFPYETSIRYIVNNLETLVGNSTTILVTKTRHYRFYTILGIDNMKSLMITYNTLAGLTILSFIVFIFERKQKIRNIKTSEIE